MDLHLELHNNRLAQCVFLVTVIVKKVIAGYVVADVIEGRVCQDDSHDYSNDDNTHSSQLYFSFDQTSDEMKVPVKKNAHNMSSTAFTSYIILRPPFPRPIDCTGDHHSTAHYAIPPRICKRLSYSLGTTVNTVYPPEGSDDGSSPTLVLRYNELPSKIEAHGGNRRLLLFGLPWSLVLTVYHLLCQSRRP